jgi:hypothetical protein
MREHLLGRMNGSEKVQSDHKLNWIIGDAD